MAFSSAAVFYRISNPVPTYRLSDTVRAWYVGVPVRHNSVQGIKAGVTPYWCVPPSLFASPRYTTTNGSKKQNEKKQRGNWMLTWGNMLEPACTRVVYMQENILLFHARKKRILHHSCFHLHPY